MIRPLGACRSWGITSRTKSPSPTRSPVMVRSQKSSGTSRTSSFPRAGMFSPVAALTARTGSPSFSWMASPSASGSSNWSRLFSTTRVGIFFSFNMSSQGSSSWGSSVRTRTARSVFSKACLVFSTRSWPRSPSSSSPAVSMKTTGPTPWSSKDLYTGSVVVPATGETREIF